MRRMFRWIFKSELKELQDVIKTTKEISETLKRQKKELEQLLGNVDISVDVHGHDHKYSPSWAVISLQGEKTDFVKFMNLGDSDIRQISNFLRQYERRFDIKVDVVPNMRHFLRIEK